MRLASSGSAGWPRGRALAWGGFFLLVLAAWAVMWQMARPAGAGVLCGAALAGWPMVAGMWAAMAAAMMAPTMVPALRTYLDLPRTGGAGFAGLLAGYLATWVVASLGFAALQVALARAGLLLPGGASGNLWLNAALFALAGGYQFTTLKDACLSACRAPLTFFMGHWRPGPFGAAVMGARMGVDCLGCCWALMGLAFVGGMANLAWMGLATLVMVMEKLPGLGGPLTRPLGWALIGAAAVCAGMALAG